jgi:hypothetical protein
LTRRRGGKDWERSATAWDAWFDVIERATQPVSQRMVEMAGIGPGSRVLDSPPGPASRR